MRVDNDEEEQVQVQNNLSDTAKRLLGPLGQMCLDDSARTEVFWMPRKVVDSAQKEFESLRGLGLKYHTMHHTFWANFVAWHADLVGLHPRFHLRLSSLS